MNKIIRNSLLAICLGFFLATGGANYAKAEVDVGIHLSLLPDLIPVPGYPVYYAPELEANFFFYEGEYWLYEDDGWYRSHWYDGPWEYVDPDFVPLFILRIPVRYYRAPPPFFRGWYYNEPPRWGHYWGPTWETRHRDWDHWDRNRVPRPAPLPSYQREYSGERYPDRQQQREIRERNYPYHPDRSGDGNRTPDRAPQQGRNNGGGWEDNSGWGGSRQQQGYERHPDSSPAVNEQRERPPQAPRYSAPPLERSQPSRQEPEHGSRSGQPAPDNSGRGQEHGRGQQPAQGRGADNEHGRNGGDRDRDGGNNH